MVEKSVKKSKRGKEEGGSQSIDLTTFLMPSPGAERQVTAQEGVREEAAYLSDEAERIILGELTSAGNKLSKSKLYEKVTRKGVRPVAFYQALTKLVESGRVKRIFDPEIEEYVYVPS
ncbi:MAG: hypothetical protein LM590_02210 [Thermofilum sp.]|jgi:chromosome condensin MukBEF MukE localization factor|nr:hypothetical protein [Thermofilum sp.]